MIHASRSAKTEPAQTRLLVIADPAQCPETCAKVREALPNAIVDCIDIDTAQKDAAKMQADIPEMPQIYATVILAIPGLDSVWRDVLRTIRAKWSYRVLPIVALGPRKWEHEAVAKEGASGYVTPEDSDPSQGRYFQNLLTALASHPLPH